MAKFELSASSLLFGTDSVKASKSGVLRRRPESDSVLLGEEMLSALLRAAPVAIGVVRDHVICWSNDELCNLTGYSVMELIGRAVQCLCSCDDDALALEEGFRVAQEKGRFTLSTRFYTHAGVCREVVLHIVGLGSPQHVSCVFTALDVTEQRRTCHERECLEQQMRETERLQSLGLLAGAVAHDFNNLLVGVLVNAELACEVSNATELNKHLQDVLTAARHGAALTDQLLAYAGKSRLEATVVDINVVVSELSELLRVSLSKKATLSLEFEEEPLWVKADPAQLRQVLMNLITNASDALNGNPGQVIVTTRRTMRQGKSLALMAVTDTGSGMTVEAKRRLFEPFFTTKKWGHGLGLSAVQGILKAHEGSIEVESRLGEGTCMTVLLPIVEPVAVPLSSTPAVNSLNLKDLPASCSPPLVLVVDDDPTVLRAQRKLLERARYRVSVASDGTEALVALERLGPQLSLMVLDATMTRMDGAETLRLLRRRFPRLPVVLCTGYSPNDLAEQYDVHELAGVIHKPFSPKDYFQVLEGALGWTPEPRSTLEVIS